MLDGFTAGIRAEQDYHLTPWHFSRIISTARTPQQVKDHILEVFENLGTENGGIIACGEIGLDAPLENINVMYETFMNYSY